MCCNTASVSFWTNRGIFVPMEINRPAINHWGQSLWQAGNSPYTDRNFHSVIHWAVHCFYFTVTCSWVTHIDDSLPVANQKVPEQASLIEVAQPNHVVYAINGWGMHVLQGAVLFLDLVLLGFTLRHKTFSFVTHLTHWISRTLMGDITFPSSSMRWIWPDSEILTSAPIGTPTLVSTHT